MNEESLKPARPVFLDSLSTEYTFYIKWSLEGFAHKYLLWNVPNDGSCSNICEYPIKTLDATVTSLVAGQG